MSNSWRQRVTQGMQQGVDSSRARAEQIAHLLIKDKLNMGLAAGGAVAGIGGLGAGINAIQDDSNGNLLFNPFSQAAILGTAGGMGGYYGTEAIEDYQNRNRPEPEFNVYDNFPARQAPGSASNAPRDPRNTMLDDMRAAGGYVEPGIGRRNYDLKEAKQAGRRGRNAVYGAGAGMLVGLMRQMGNQHPQQEYCS